MRNLLLFLALSALSAPASAALYKWLNERGGVTYGDTPPANARALTPVPTQNLPISVVDGPSKAELDRMREYNAQARRERHERELAQIRAQPPVPVPVPIIVSTDAPLSYPVVVANPRWRNPSLPSPQPQQRAPRNNARDNFGVTVITPNARR